VGTPKLLQVLLPELEYMLILGGIWSFCITHFLRNRMLQHIFADSPWVLHRSWAAIGHRAAQHCSSWVSSVLDSDWLQSCCTTIFCTWWMLKMAFKCWCLLLHLCFSHVSSTPQEHIQRTRIPWVNLKIQVKFSLSLKPCALLITWFSSGLVGHN
jgi:hypothetical protein